MDGKYVLILYHSHSERIADNLCKQINSFIEDAKAMQICINDIKPLPGYSPLDFLINTLANNNLVLLVSLIDIDLIGTYYNLLSDSSEFKKVMQEHYLRKYGFCLQVDHHIAKKVSYLYNLMESRHLPNFPIQSIEGSNPIAHAARNICYIYEAIKNTIPEREISISYIFNHEQKIKNLIVEYCKKKLRNSQDNEFIEINAFSHANHIVSYMKQKIGTKFVAYYYEDPFWLSPTEFCAYRDIVLSKLSEIIQLLKENDTNLFLYKEPISIDRNTFNDIINKMPQ